MTAACGRGCAVSVGWSLVTKRRERKERAKRTTGGKKYPVDTGNYKGDVGEGAEFISYVSG